MTSSFNLVFPVAPTEVGAKTISHAIDAQDSRSKRPASNRPLVLRRGSRFLAACVIDFLK